MPADNVRGTGLPVQGAAVKVIATDGVRSCMLRHGRREYLGVAVDLGLRRRLGHQLVGASVLCGEALAFPVEQAGGGRDHAVSAR